MTHTNSELQTRQQLWYDRPAVYWEEALPLVTTNVAKALRLYPVKGTITPGCDGDLLLLDQDLKVDTVFARGKMMMESSQLLVKGMFEA